MFGFVNIGPHGSENLKCSSPQSYDSFSNQTFSKYSLWQSSRKLLLGILKFQIEFKKKKIENFFHMGPYGSENFKNTTPTVMILL